MTLPGFQLMFLMLFKRYDLSQDLNFWNLNWNWPRNLHEHFLNIFFFQLFFKNCFVEKLSIEGGAPYSHFASHKFKPKSKIDYVKFKRLSKFITNYFYSFFIWVSIFAATLTNLKARCAINVKLSKEFDNAACCPIWAQHINVPRCTVSSNIACKIN